MTYRSVGIVGHEAAKFTPETMEQSKTLIRALLLFEDVRVVSGDCPLGGIDVWAEEIADELGRPKLIFPPKYHRWAPEGFEERNIKIAQHSDVVIVIVARVLPDEYRGRRFDGCYHCEKHGRTYNHIKSGACWTAFKALEFEKQAEWLEVG